MRSDELVSMARESADIGTVAAWPDWTDARILRVLSQRHKSLMSDEEIRARAGYGVQTFSLACTIGEPLYPVPPRAVGGAFEKLEIQLPGQTKWDRLERVDVTGSEEYDFGTADPGRPTHYSVRDGFVELYRSPNAAYPLKFTFYMRPSQLVTSQSSALAGAGDAVVRGLITAKNAAARTVTVNVVPFDQLLAVPAAITTGVQQIDIVRPNATFALAMYSQTQTLAGTTFTLGGTDSMSRVQIGDFVRVADQTDWPMGLPDEFHPMVGNRAAMEIARDIGVEEKVQMLGAVTQADLERFHNTRNPQVKSAPKVIPLRPMSFR